MSVKIQLEALNSAQRKAVETIHGRLLILAGAGSGKTRVLTMRMAHLINTHKISPKSILGLTFTNKAADEMRHRLCQYVDKAQAKHVTLCTFHSFCMKLLRQEIEHLGFTRNFTLYDEKDIQRLVCQIARDITGIQGDLPSLASTLAVISKAKNQGISPDNFGKEGGVWHDQFASEVYKRLLDSMRAHNALDFDSLLTSTVELFERFPNVLEKYQERFRYIMIDEYQDTNPIQFRLAELLASGHHNLCVVGDDDQSIYGWRGAEVKNILSFSCSTKIKLEQNYRSTNTILQAANAVIGRNTERHAKELWSDNGAGTTIEVFHAPDEHREAEAVIRRADRLRKEQGLKWSDIAILYRSNALSRCIETALMQFAWHNGNSYQLGVPYQIFGGTAFYERSEVKDMVAYLKVIANPCDEGSLLRIINVPRRGVGENTLDILTQYNRKNAFSLWSVIDKIVTETCDTEILRLKDDIICDLIKEMNNKAIHGLLEFHRIITEAQRRFAEYSLHEAMRWLIDSVNYRQAINEEVKSEQMRSLKWENVQELVNAMSVFTSSESKPILDDDRLDAVKEDGKKALRQLCSFIDTVSLDQHHQVKEDHDCNKINLVTFHSSKGLEFPACFLVGIEDHIIPHEKSAKETGVEEERRLMYVAITRAMRFLTISMAEKRLRMGKEEKSKPSRFLFEIPRELLQPTRWDF